MRIVNFIGNGLNNKLLIRERDKGGIWWVYEWDWKL